MKSRFDTLSSQDTRIAEMDKSRKRTEDAAVIFLRCYDQKQSDTETYPSLKAFLSAVSQLDRCGFFENSSDRILNTDLVLEAVKAMKERYKRIDYDALFRAKLITGSITDQEKYVEETVQKRADNIISKLGTYSAAER